MSKPTKEGWYWFNNAFNTKHEGWTIVEIDAELEEDELTLYAYISGDDQPQDINCDQSYAYDESRWGEPVAPNGHIAELEALLRGGDIMLLPRRLQEIVEKLKEADNVV